MTAEIPNLIANVSEVIETFDRSNFWTTIFAVGIGAWGAYIFNLRQMAKQQKETQKAQLVQLFYDLNILSKYIYRYGANAKNLIENIYNGAVPYNTPLSMNPDTINIEQLGFITLKSHKMYEILAHTKMEIVTIFEQGIVYNEAVIKKKKDTIMQLVTINTLLPKLIAMIYVNLFNINSMLVKYYKSENLIKENVLTNMAEMLEVVAEAKKQSYEIIESEDKICPYTGELYTDEQKEAEKEDIEYIEYVLNNWILDFGLRKEKKII